MPVAGLLFLLEIHRQHFEALLDSSQPLCRSVPLVLCSGSQKFHNPCVQTCFSAHREKKVNP